MGLQGEDLLATISECDEGDEKDLSTKEYKGHFTDPPPPPSMPPPQPPRLVAISDAETSICENQTKYCWRCYDALVIGAEHSDLDTFSTKDPIHMHLEVDVDSRILTLSNAKDSSQYTLVGLSVASIHISLEKNTVFTKGHVCFVETPSYLRDIRAPDVKHDIRQLRFYVCVSTWKDMQAFVKFCELSSDKSRFSFFGVKMLSASDMLQTPHDTRYEDKMKFLKQEAQHRRATEGGVGGGGSVGNPLHSVMASSMKWFRQHLTTQDCLHRVKCPSSHDLGIVFHNRGREFAVVGDSLRHDVEIGSVLVSVGGDWVLPNTFKDTTASLSRSSSTTVDGPGVELGLASFPKLQSFVDVRFQAERGQESACLKEAVVILSGGMLRIGCHPQQLRSTSDGGSGTMMTRGMLPVLELFKEPALLLEGSSSRSGGGSFQSTASGTTFFRLDLSLSRVHWNAHHNLVHIFSSSAALSSFTAKTLVCTLGPFGPAAAAAVSGGLLLIEWTVALHTSVLLASGGDFGVIDDIPDEELFSSSDDSRSSLEDDDDSSREGEGSRDDDSSLEDDGRELTGGTPPDDPHPAGSRAPSLCCVCVLFTPPLSSLLRCIVPYRCRTFTVTVTVPVPLPLPYPYPYPYPYRYRYCTVPASDLPRKDRDRSPVTYYLPLPTGDTYLYYNLSPR
jgi:hypothetical protein